MIKEQDFSTDDDQLLDVPDLGRIIFGPSFELLSREAHYLSKGVV